MKKWIVVDVPNLAHRAWHTTKGLMWEGKSTGVQYGVLREVRRLEEFFGSPYFVFCFESKTSLRMDVFPEYKEFRRKGKEEVTDEERKEWAMFHGEMKQLRREVLPAIGYRNVLARRGYEADDMIALACDAITEVKDEAVIVSVDHDMWQLLNSRVTIYDPIRKRILTDKWFRDEWGLSPSQWTDVKAIAGCGSDGVPGIQGIGEKTAAKYLKGEVKSGSKTYDKIIEGTGIWKRNMELVQLPFPRAEAVVLVEDNVTVDKWREQLSRLGIRKVKV